MTFNYGAGNFLCPYFIKQEGGRHTIGCAEKKMAIYRNYENPRELEAQKAVLLQKIEMDQIEAAQEGRAVNIDLQIELLNLEERINFAWQDEEYEEDCRRAEAAETGYPYNEYYEDSEYCKEEEEYEL